MRSRMPTSPNFVSPSTQAYSLEVYTISFYLSWQPLDECRARGHWFEALSGKASSARVQGRVSYEKFVDEKLPSSFHQVRRSDACRHMSPLSNYLAVAAWRALGLNRKHEEALPMFSNTQRRPLCSRIRFLRLRVESVVCNGSFDWHTIFSRCCPKNSANS